jgi:hypothetical protein
LNVAWRRAGIERRANVLGNLGLDCRHRGIGSLAFQVSHFTQRLFDGWGGVCRRACYEDA